MREFGRTRAPVFDQLPRPPNITEQPSCLGEVDRRADTGIQAEAELGLTIALGIVNLQRLFEMRPLLQEVALPQTRHAQNAVGNRRFCQAARSLRLI